MFYCPNCNNIYEITKTIPNILNPDQVGGQVSDTPDTVSSTTKSSTSDVDNVINKVIKKIFDGDVISVNDVRGISLNSLIKNPTYKKLQNKMKDKVYNKISDLIPNVPDNEKFVQPISSNAYFICKNCGNYEQMKSNTLIVKKIYDDENTDLEDSAKFKDFAHINYIPTTRNYICQNKKCLSHTDHSKRAAKFYRIPRSFRVRYICLTCEESWTS